MSVPLLVLRHGATAWNERRVIQGRADPPLSAAGRAAVLAWRMPDGWRDAHAVTSPLARAVETAELIGLGAEVEARLVEMAWGEWEGRTLADLRAELGEAMAENEARGLDFRPPGGESPRDVQERLAPLLASLARPTIAVTHRGVLRALYARAVGWSMQGKAPDRLRDGCGHLFRVEMGNVFAERLNVPLDGRP
jgi:probable phosphoglycerate mutase